MPSKAFPQKDLWIWKSRDTSTVEPNAHEPRGKLSTTIWYQEPPLVPLSKCYGKTDNDRNERTCSPIWSIQKQQSRHIQSYFIQVTLYPCACLEIIISPESSLSISCFSPKLHVKKKPLSSSSQTAKSDVHFNGEQFRDGPHQQQRPWLGIPLHSYFSSAGFRSEGYLHLHTSLLLACC